MDERRFNLYNKVIFMRSRIIAPVDVAGCHTIRETSDTEDDQNFQLLCSVILSSQTKDIIIGQVMAKLKQIPCTPQAILAANENDIQQVIQGVSFHQRKTEYLQRSAKMVLEQYGGKIPNTLKELQKLPGIGPKTGALYLTHSTSSAEKRIAVDTHLHRLFNRWGWVQTTDPIKTQQQVEQWLPQELRKDINQIVVGFGQTVCFAINPRCDICLVRNICPSSTSKTVKRSDMEDLGVLIEETKAQREKLLGEFAHPGQCKWGNTETNW